MHFTVVVQVKRCGLPPIGLTARIFMRSTRGLISRAEKSEAEINKFPCRQSCKMLGYTGILIG